MKLVPCLNSVHAVFSLLDIFSEDRKLYAQLFS